MLDGTTIVAVASPTGRSTRGIVRVSGALTAQALARAVRTAPVRPGVHLVELACLPGALPAIAVFWRAPRSYTGEDAAELIVPGNPWLIERIVARMVQTGGVRTAGAGEFTARAYLAGKLTVEQAEGVQAAVAARTQAELTAADRLRSGEQGAAYRALADDLAGTLALVEAGIDFTDQEDVVAIGPGELADRLESMLGVLEGLVGGRSGRVRSGLARVVLVGAPNAGKSTLFNALVGRERTLVSDRAGTTRDVITEEIVVGPRGGVGERVVELCDLAGLDSALAERSEADRGAHEAAVSAANGADVIIVCDADGRFDLAALGLNVRAIAGVAIVRVRTKADLVHAPETDGDDDGGEIAVCALDGWRLDRVRGAIAEAVAGSAPGGEALVLARHAEALSAANEAVRRALGELGPVRTGRHLARPEMIAASLREALDRVGEIVGEISPDDVIGRVFATFCVGK